MKVSTIERLQELGRKAGMLEVAIGAPAKQIEITILVGALMFELDEPEAEIDCAVTIFDEAMARGRLLESFHVEQTKGSEP